MTRFRVWAFAALALLTAPARSDETVAGPLASQRGRYLVTASAAMAPVAINRMHAWTLVVASRDGALVDGAVIEIAAAVPGLARMTPTAPRVTRSFGGGRYLIEGMKFDMAGRWRLRVVIGTGDDRDEADFPVDVK